MLPLSRLAMSSGFRPASFRLCRSRLSTEVEASVAPRVSREARRARREMRKANTAPAEASGSSSSARATTTGTLRWPVMLATTAGFGAVGWALYADPETNEVAHTVQNLPPVRNKNGSCVVPSGGGGLSRCRWVRTSFDDREVFREGFSCVMSPRGMPTARAVASRGLRARVTADEHPRDLQPSSPPTLWLDAAWGCSCVARRSSNGCWRSWSTWRRPSRHRHARNCFRIGRWIT